MNFLAKDALIIIIEKGFNQPRSVTFSHNLPVFLFHWSLLAAKRN